MPRNALNPRRVEEESTKNVAIPLHPYYFFGARRPPGPGSPGRRRKSARPRRSWRGHQRRRERQRRMRQRGARSMSLAPRSAPGKNWQILQMFAKFCNFWRARSRQYQNEFLQENMRLAVFFNRYKICILLHRSHRYNLNMLI